MWNHFHQADNSRRRKNIRSLEQRGRRTWELTVHAVKRTYAPPTEALGAAQYKKYFLA